MHILSTCIVGIILLYISWSYKEMTRGKAPLFHAVMGDLYGAATFCEVCNALDKVGSISSEQNVISGDKSEKADGVCSDADI